MKKYIYSFLIILFSISSCDYNKNQIEEVEIIGCWFYMDNESIYTEIYIDSSKVLFYSSENGWSGPYSYWMENNSIQFHGIQYNIGENGCNALIWKNPEFTLNIRKIECIRTESQYPEINPYYLRRCNYLVNAGIITMTDAIEYLNSFVINDSIEYEEEKLFFNK